MKGVKDLNVCRWGWRSHICNLPEGHTEPVHECECGDVPLPDDRVFQWDVDNV